MNEKDNLELNMQKLATIVKELENGEIPLEKAVELYSEGVKLPAVWKKQIDHGKIKITEVK